MKMNISKYLLLGGMAFALASCATEEFKNDVPADNYRLHVNLPEDLSSRAIGDASTATQLYVMVFDADNDNKFILNSVTRDAFANNNSVEVGLDLVYGKSYNIILFAGNPDAVSFENQDAVYYINTETGNLTVNYQAMTSESNNEDLYGCFYSCKETGIVTATNSGGAVSLKRPVAQVNWGTKQVDNSDKLPVFTTTLVSDQSVPNTLNMISGEVSGEAELQFSNFTAPTDTYPVSGYDYVGMFYVLADGENSATYDLTMTITQTDSTGDYINTINVASVPVQANYQTNIYGSLLTVNATFTVTKDTWADSDYDFPSQAVAPEQDEDDIYLMRNQGNFIWLAEQVNGGEKFAGETFQLQNDIYFTETLSPIGINQNYPFQGNFDGANYTLHNVVVEADATVSATGIFGFTSGKNTISNININNITVTGHHSNVGALVGSCQMTNINNITLTGLVQIQSNNNNVGGIVGSVNEISLSNLTINAEEGSFVNGSYNVGGVVGGFGYYVSSVSNLTSNINVTGSSYNVGGISGAAYANNNTKAILFDTCTCTGIVTSTASGNNAYTIGGIAGSWGNETDKIVSFVNCNFDGKLVSNNASQDFDLQTVNAITGLSTASTAVGTLYISTSKEASTENVAEQHIITVAGN